LSIVIKKLILHEKFGKMEHALLHVNYKRVRVVLFNVALSLTYLSNMSAIWALSALLMEKTGVPRENHRPVASH